MDVDDLTLWGQQTGESAKAYHAFLHFLHLPSWTRSMATAYTNHRTDCKHQTHTKPLHAPNDWTAWRMLHHWVARAHAHDADVAARDRLRRLADIEQMQARHIALAVAVQNLAVQQLQHLIATNTIPKLSPLQLTRVINLATTVERRARGVPTEIIRHENEATGGALLDLSALTPDELVSFEKMIARCTPRSIADRESPEMSTLFPGKVRRSPLCFSATAVHRVLLDAAQQRLGLTRVPGFAARTGAGGLTEPYWWRRKFGRAENEG